MSRKFVATSLPTSPVAASARPRTPKEAKCVRSDNPELGPRIALQIIGNAVGVAGHACVLGSASAAALFCEFRGPQGGRTRTRTRELLRGEPERISIQIQESVGGFSLILLRVRGFAIFLGTF